MIQNLPLFPEQASTIAARVDLLYYFLVAVSGFFALLIASLIVLFAIRYRRREQRLEEPEGEGALALEIAWSVVPFGLAMAMFVWGASLYVEMRRPPDDAVPVYVVGKRWMWKVQHLEGRREINELHVPTGRPIKLVMTSEDVIHDFFVPAFRVKQDAVPGRYTSMWFEATKPGRYHLFCAEYCGSQHSRMIGEVIAMEPADFQRWLSGATAGAGAVSMVDAGAALFAQLGCATCHKGASAGRGPVLAGLAGTEVKLAGGRAVRADDAYLRESILDPQAKVAAGYQPIMPTYKGLVSEEQLLQLIAYLGSLESPARVTDVGARPPGAGARE
jgi:cytochrome c oxidase subunit II